MVRRWSVVQRVAFSLIGGGTLVALGFFLEWFITTSDISLFWRITIGVVLVGIVLLLASVVWERYRAAKGKEEEFKEVEH